MSGKIYTGQKIPLSTSFTDDDGVVVITGGTVVYNYYYPSNKTSTPSGSVDGTIEDGAAGTASGEITASLNTEARAGLWRVQAKVTLSADEWYEKTTTFTTNLPGS